MIYRDSIKKYEAAGLFGTVYYSDGLLCCVVLCLYAVHPHPHCSLTTQYQRFFEDENRVPPMAKLKRNLKFTIAASG